MTSHHYSPGRIGCQIRIDVLETLKGGAEGGAEGGAKGGAVGMAAMQLHVSGPCEQNFGELIWSVQGTCAAASGTRVTSVQLKAGSKAKAIEYIAVRFFSSPQILPSQGKPPALHHRFFDAMAILWLCRAARALPPTCPPYMRTPHCSMALPLTRR
jgi:hypothetical protein